MASVNEGINERLEKLEAAVAALQAKLTPPEPLIPPPDEVPPPELPPELPPPVEVSSSPAAPPPGPLEPPPELPKFPLVPPLPGAADEPEPAA